MKKILLPLILLISSCQTSKQAVMTREGFSEVSIGSSVDKLLEEYGEPYAITSKGNEIYEYEYIERVLLGREVVMQQRYYITVQDGKVIDKKMTSSRPPAFEAIYSDNPVPNY